MILKVQKAIKVRTLRRIWPEDKLMLNMNKSCSQKDAQT